MEQLLVSLGVDVDGMRVDLHLGQLQDLRGQRQHSKSLVDCAGMGARVPHRAWEHACHAVHGSERMPGTCMQQM